MLENEEQEELLNTLAEAPEEEVRTIAEDIYVIGVESLNGQAGDLTLKSINSENLVGEGDIALQTPLTQDQLLAVNSGIDSAKVEQIATNATAITTLQNTKQDNLTQAQLNAVNSGIDATKVAQIATNTGNTTSNTNRLTTIEGKIPSAASSSNKLTDKNYVDNAIATNTANYISDNGQPFQSYADLVAYSGPLTNNDYAFVETIDQAGNDVYTRYKYNASQNQWAAEYTITNPYFTSDQWASINSGIAANDVTQIANNKTDIATLQTSKQDTLTTAQQAAVDSGIDSTKVTQIANNTNSIATLQTSKQDKLTAGANVTISGTTISATNTTYSAGDGLDLTGTEFSVVEPAPEGFFSDANDTQTSEGTNLTIQTTTAPLSNARLLGDSFQQTYTGKNLVKVTATSHTVNTITFTVNNDGTIVANGTNGNAVTSINLISGGTIVLPAGEYENSGCPDGGSNDTYRLDINNGTNSNQTCYGAPKTFTLTSELTITSYRIRIAPNAVINNLVFKPMIRPTGVGDSSFEPYTGSTPSQITPAPNPDYPQEIQVVTGDQTVTMTGNQASQSQTYPISLGTLELAKFGNYQDYLWTDGEKWYKHGALAKATFDGDENWSIANSGTANYYYRVTSTIVTASDTAMVLSNYETGRQITNSNTQSGIWKLAGGQVRIRGGAEISLSQWTTKLSSNPLIIYVPQGTPTDEEITNETLISQLNALLRATTYYGTTNVTSTATSPNLAAILSIESFKNNLHGIVSGAEKQTIATIDERLDGLSLTALTQAEYDALTAKDANTLYIIKADS